MSSASSTTTGLPSSTAGGRKNGSARRRDAQNGHGFPTTSSGEGDNYFVDVVFEPSPTVTLFGAEQPATPAVVDGFTDLILELWGDAGRHARSAVGVAELPFDIPVEVEAVVQVSVR